MVRPRRSSAASEDESAGTARQQVCALYWRWYGGSGCRKVRTNMIVVLIYFAGCRNWGVCTIILRRLYCLDHLEVESKLRAHYASQRFEPEGKRRGKELYGIYSEERSFREAED